MCYDFLIFGGPMKTIILFASLLFSLSSLASDQSVTCSVTDYRHDFERVLLKDSAKLNYQTGLVSLNLGGYGKVSFSAAATSTNKISMYAMIDGVTVSNTFDGKGSMDIYAENTQLSFDCEIK